MWPSPANGTFPHSFKQLEHYTFYGVMATIPKEVPILGAETQVLTTRSSSTDKHEPNFKGIFKQVYPSQSPYLIWITSYCFKVCIYLQSGQKSLESWTEAYSPARPAPKKAQAGHLKPQALPDWPLVNTGKYQYQEWHTYFQSWKFGLILVVLAWNCNMNLMTKYKHNPIPFKFAKKYVQLAWTK